VRRGVRDVVNMAKEPLAAISDSLQNLAQEIKTIVKPIQQAVTRMLSIFNTVGEHKSKER